MSATSSAVRGEAKPAELRNADRQCQVTEIERHGIECVGDQIVVELADVHPLEAHHAVVLAQRSEQLSVSDLNRVDAPHARVQQCLREAAGGGSRIECYRAGQCDPPMLKRDSSLRLPRRTCRSLIATELLARTNERGFVTMLPSTSTSPARIRHPLRRDPRTPPRPGCEASACERCSSSPAYDGTGVRNGRYADAASRRSTAWTR